MVERAEEAGAWQVGETAHVREQQLQRAEASAVQAADRVVLGAEQPEPAGRATDRDDQRERRPPTCRRPHGPAVERPGRLDHRRREPGTLRRRRVVLEEDLARGEIRSDHAPARVRSLDVQQRVDPAGRLGDGHLGLDARGVDRAHQRERALLMALRALGRSGGWRHVRLLHSLCVRGRARAYLAPPTRPARAGRDPPQLPRRRTRPA